MSDSKSTSGGIGFFGLLTIAFIVLKLTKFIDWSWWWVTCPLWGPVAIFLIIAFVTLLLALWGKLFSTDKQKQQMRRIIEDQKQGAGKSKWQERLEQMQKENAKK